MCPANMEGNWTELCEMEAIKAAKVFAQSYHNYLVSQETSDGTSQNTPEPSRVGQLFVDHFMEHFELELRRATIVVNGNARLSLVEPVINENNHTNITNGTAPPTGHSSPERSRESSLGRNEEVPVPQNRNVARVRNNQSPDLARKLSVRFWDKTSNIIEKFRRQGRSRTANLPNPNDIVREGHVSVMSGDDRLWDRSRLMLLRKEGGYMLEFYTPPKVSLQRNPQTF
ncbi:SH2B adapter protein 2 [Holothuria leucospilota]|uniref:SH2B adapter protein 2 n=1 Tax=Holothuria leucospilota TaxID=206669 RepID=A0A9Q1HEK3_HOLLE|nr:SH2B adapter protein 2 [Holothuria leucospilota]